jgi:hypothetical protein
LNAFYQQKRQVGSLQLAVGSKKVGGRQFQLSVKSEKTDIKIKITF